LIYTQEVRSSLRKMVRNINCRGGGNGMVLGGGETKIDPLCTGF
jgi:hypothetical protein